MTSRIRAAKRAGVWEFTARLVRGDGWLAYRSTSGPLVLFVVCPACGQLNALGSSTVDADGTVRAPFACVHPGCLQLTYRLVLEGWPFTEVHNPVVHAVALCQADGAGY